MIRVLEHLSFEMQLKAQFLSRAGDEFQQLFTAIMLRCHPGDYQKVCPWGNDGDRKNDGYLKSERKLFQCYAPHELRQDPTLRKIDEDFAGALPYWEEHFDEWVFVHNVLRGTPAFAAQRLLALEQAHTPLRLSPWGYDEIARRLFRLERPDIVAILGPPLTEEALSEVAYEDLAVVLRTIAGRDVPSDAPVRPVPADKLYTNQLSEDVAAFLRIGMRKADLVGRFFAQWYDVTLGDRAAEVFRARYQELKAGGLTPDEIFHELHLFAGGALALPQKQSAAVLAVLAYFFEQCDIFEAARPSAAA
jgi:hypothetical protein